ncbi:hypothetical protein SEA_MISCHIEF19_4 [Streptomyces phage Mischief19]|nr:hypothetical protein SEA_MISCHIEF19_4 [Streptomyces phage Mischief19]
MAERSFAINTEPHVFNVGDVKLLLQPEVVGAEFATAYADLRKVQTRVQQSQKLAKASSTKHKAAEADGIDADVLTDLHEAMRSFLRRFMLPASQEVFDGLRLPDRILVAMLEAAAELYGTTGDEPRPTGGSTESQEQSATTGTSGSAS